MGNMIGSGIFLLPASLSPYGALGLLGWIISTAGALALAVVFARLAHLDPAGGGPYAYTRRAFGDLAGFLVAWGYWISMWTALGALGVAFAGYAGSLVPSMAATPAAAALSATGAVWFLVAVNSAGIRTAAWMQIATTILKILPLLAIGAIGLLRLESSRFAAPDADARAVLSAASAGATLTLWAFLGLESATVPADHITNARRTVPRATIVGTLLTAIIYIGGTAGTMSLLPASVLGASQAPFADAARVVWGPAGSAAVALGAAISAFGALNGWILMTGHLSLAVARDGLFPRAFARVSRNGTPVLAMIVAGAFTTVLVALNYTRELVDLFTFFILLSTLATLIPFAFSSLAVFLLRDEARRPLSRGLGVTAALAFAYSLWAIGGAGQAAVYWGFLLLMAGLPLYVARRLSAGRS